MGEKVLYIRTKPKVNVKPQSITKAVRNTCKIELDGIGSVNTMKTISKGSFEYI